MTPKPPTVLTGRQPLVMASEIAWTADDWNDRFGHTPIGQKYRELVQRIATGTRPKVYLLPRSR